MRAGRSPEVNWRHVLSIAGGLVMRLTAGHRLQARASDARDMVLLHPERSVISAASGAHILPADGVVSVSVTAHPEDLPVAL